MSEPTNITNDHPEGNDGSNNNSKDAAAFHLGSNNNQAGSNIAYTGRGNVVQKIYTYEERYDVSSLESPYLGLGSFKYEDRAKYAGRDADIEKAVKTITMPGEQRSLYFIIGASGSGKSSFAQAGLLPGLEKHYINLRRLRHAVFRPLSNPLDGLTEALQKIGSTTPLGHIISATQINSILHTLSTPTHLPVLIIDQFEEVFTEATVEKREELFTFLENLPAYKEVPFHVLITMRSDFLTDLYNYNRLYDWAKQGIDLRAMGAKELQTAIKRPLEHLLENAGLVGEKQWEPALLEKLADDATQDAAYLPLLQVTLDDIFRDGSLRYAAYSTLSNAISKRAEKVYNYTDYNDPSPTQERSTAQRQTIESIFLDLVEVSLDEDPYSNPKERDFRARRDVRRARTVNELIKANPDRLPLIEDLVKARLLSKRSVTRDSTVRVDIIHESLLSNWDRLNIAIGKKDERLQHQTRFKHALNEWLDHKREDRYLLRDVRLAEAQKLQEDNNIEVQPTEAQELIKRSIALLESEKAERDAEKERLDKAEKERALEQQERQKEKRLRQKVTGLSSIIAILLVIAVVLAVIVYKQRDRAEKTADVRTLVFQSQNDNVPPLSQLMLRLEASKRLVANKMYAPEQSNFDTDLLVRQTFEPLLSWLPSNPSPLPLPLAHTERIYSAAWSPDGQRIVTVSEDKDTKIWNANDGTLLHILQGHSSAIWGVAWSPDSQRIVTVSQDATAKIWDVNSGTELGTLTGAQGHSEWIWGVAWSPDGKYIATVSSDKTAKIWEATTGTFIQTMVGHKNVVWAVAWSPDSQRIVTASDDNTAKIWDVTTGKELRTLQGSQGHSLPVRGVAWSEQGGIATASNDTTVKIWNPITGVLSQTLQGHTGYVRGVAWSPDGQRIASTSRDKTVKLWNASTGTVFTTLSGHTQDIWSVAWSPDGQRIVTASSDKTAKIWNTRDMALITTLQGHTDNVWDAAWSPVEQRIATASRDTTAKIWDATTGKELRTLQGHTGGLWKVAWSPNGEKIATASDDATARIWNARDGTQLITITGHLSAVKSLAWSPNSLEIVTTSKDGTAKIWNATTGEQLRTLPGHTDEVGGVAWSEQGGIATASNDTTVKIWNPITGVLSQTLQGHTDAVREVAWSPDGKTIATASSDRTAKIWNATTGKELRTLSGHINAVRGVAWSSDGKHIATTSLDRTVKIWNASDGALILTIQGHTDIVWSAAWSRDGKLVTASSDKTAQVYFIPSPLQLNELIAFVEQRLPKNIPIASQDLQPYTANLFDKTLLINRLLQPASTTIPPSITPTP